jgi:hypothetical protein
VVFDKRTGRVLHTHSRFSVKENRYVAIPADELKKSLASDRSIADALTDQNPDNLEVIEIGPQATDHGIAVMVDVARQAVVPLPIISLTADKQEILGNGQDSARIDIEVKDAGGNPVSNFSGRVKLTTTRGKLSARGGLVDLVDGKASITLTSVPETVDNVRVQVMAVDGLCSGGHVTLEFV